MRGDYVLAQKIEQLLYKEGNGDGNYYAVIMAAMRMADSANLRHLQMSWPHVWEELQERYSTPGGYTKAELKEVNRRAAELASAEPVIVHTEHAGPIKTTKLEPILDYDFPATGMDEGSFTTFKFAVGDHVWCPKRQEPGVVMALKADEARYHVSFGTDDIAWYCTEELEANPG